MKAYQTTLEFQYAKGAVMYIRGYLTWSVSSDAIESDPFFKECYSYEKLWRYGVSLGYNEVQARANAVFQIWPLGVNL